MSAPGKIRLNIVAQEGETTQGKFLVCIEASACIEDLFPKIAKALSRQGISGRALRLTNVHGACLPDEDCLVYEVLRDEEEVRGMLQLLKDDVMLRTKDAQEPEIEDGRHGPRAS